MTKVLARVLRRKLTENDSSTPLSFDGPGGIVANDLCIVLQSVVVANRVVVQLGRSQVPEK